MGLGEVARARGLSSRFPQARKPLVEKKRRARINESLQELRLLLAGTEVRRERCRGEGDLQGAPRSARPDSTPFPSAQVQAKLENAEVLELTVRRVQGALRGRARGEWRRGSRAGALTGHACHPTAGHVDSRSPGPIHGKGFPQNGTRYCVSWVSPEPAERIVRATIVTAHGAGRCSLLPTLLHRAGAAAG